MGVKNIKVGSLTVDAIFIGSLRCRKVHHGTDIVFDHPVHPTEPKIDTMHSLANRQTARSLTLGATTGMTSVSGAAQVVDNAYASNVAGTLSMHRIAFPAANSNNFRVSALIKIDKTAGRYSRIGFATGNLTSSPDAYVGHAAGSGIIVGSVNFTVGAVHSTVLSETQCVDGAWYRVSMTYDNVLDYDTSDTNPGRARIQATAEPVLAANNPADPWYPPVSNGRFDSVAPTAYVPSVLTCRTNSALGTIRDLYYIDSIYGATSNGTDAVDNAPVLHQWKVTAGGTDNSWIWSKGKAAPLRIIIAAGGSGVYGGMDFAHANGRSGHPYNAFRKFWRDLADKGYTVLHTTALHEGWGADDHLAKQLAALTQLQSLTGVADARLYYIGYSLGGASLWRALRGRSGFPPIRAAYSLAGISRLTYYWDINGMYAACRTRWPVRANIDEPQAYTTAELVARGTRVRMITSTGDTNVDKTAEHDPMFAKYAGTGLASERVFSGIGHFDPAYWDAVDCVNFFEAQDLDLL